MAKRQFQTNFTFWLFLTGCLFFALGFVDIVAGVAKSDTSLWATVAVLASGDYSCDTEAFVVPILFQLAIWMLVALILGWVLQAVVVVVRGSRRSSV